MDPNQPAGAGAPADDTFMSELFGTGDAQQGQRPEPQERQEPDQQQPQAREHERIPLRELLDERDKRQAAERRLAEFEAAEKKRAEEANQGQQPGNFWDGPEAYFQSQEKRLMGSFEQREQALRQDFQRQRIEMDERFVRMSNPDEFGPAETWFLEQAKANPALAQAFVQQPSPCGWMLEQYRQSKVLGEVGSDPNAYRQKLLDEALKDPDFLARAMEASRGGGQPRSDNGQFQPAPKTQPQRPTLPSMRAAGSAGVVATRPSGDQSGGDLLDEVMAGT